MGKNIRPTCLLYMGEGSWTFLKVVSKHVGLAMGRHVGAAMGRHTDLVLDASLPKHKKQAKENLRIEND